MAGRRPLQKAHDGLQGRVTMAGRGDILKDGITAFTVISAILSIGTVVSGVRGAREAKIRHDDMVMRLRRIETELGKLAGKP